MNGILAWGKHGLSPFSKPVISDHIDSNQWGLTPLIFLVLVLLFAAIHPAAAVTVTASNGLSCAGTRSTTILGCTAGEFTTIVNITNAPGAPTSCVAGEYVIYNGMVSLSGTNADRYDIGFFTGENGNDPGLNNASNFCSVATFPTTPLPWIAKDTDACGDFSAKGVDNAAINSIKVLCAGDATGAMMIPYTLVYSQNAGSVCTGPKDVVGGSTSKCNKGIAVVPVATFTVNGSVKVTKKTVPAGDAQSFAFTASGTGPVMSGDTSFNLIDNGVTKQVRMGISGTNQTLTITETAADTNLWEPTTTIACTLLDGITPAGFVATNGVTRTITATLSNTNPNAVCTITNKRAVSATSSTVVANPTSVSSDGVSTSTITVTLKDTSAAGNPVAGKTVTLTAGSGSSTITTVTGVTDVNGQATFTVKDAVQESVTYTATDATDGITIAQTATVTFISSISGFNAFESTMPLAAISGLIYTKLAGTPFGLDVVAVAGSSKATGFSGNVKVELLANTGTAGSGYDGANNCPTSSSVIQTIASTPIASGRSTVNFAAVAAAYRDVRVRISYPTTSPTVVACSTDSFAIRPSAVTLATNANAVVPSASATPTIAAGNAFTLNATTATGTNYNGTLTLDTTTVPLKLTAQTTTQNASMQSGGVVGTLTPTSLTANPSPPPSNNATYSEVGYLYLGAGTYRDDTYTSVDQPSGCAATNSCDCVTDTTSDANLADTLVLGKYGCSIGNKTAVSFGRFIPDHFDTVVTGGMVCTAGLSAMTPTCPATGFVYSGQPFTTYVTAKNASDVKTNNYSGVFAKAVTLNAVDKVGGAAVAVGSIPAANSSASAAAFVTGMATLPIPATAPFTYQPTIFKFTTEPTSPTNMFVRAVESSGGDAVSSLRATAANSVEGGFKVVSGRVKIGNAYGSELLPLPIVVMVQYWDGSTYVTNTADGTTSLAATGISLINGQKNTFTGCPATCPTSISPAAIVFNNPTNGFGKFTLSKPNVSGSIDMAVIVPADCATVPTQAACYFGSNIGRATFGVYKGNSGFIYLRENY